MLRDFLQRKIASYNIGEMAIILSLLSAMSIFAAILFGLLLKGLGVSFPIAMLVSALAWLGFNVWLWVSMVKAGRTLPGDRATSAEITVLQVIVALVLGLHMLFGPASEQDKLHKTEVGFEWIIIGFHIVYFTLAWGMRARVPARTYLMFLLLVVLAFFRTFGSPANSGADLMVRPVNLTFLAAQPPKSVGKARAPQFSRDVGQAKGLVSGTRGSSEGYQRRRS